MARGPPRPARVRARGACDFASWRCLGGTFPLARGAARKLDFAERGIASHWKYKSSEKFSELSWKEYDWLKDLVEIMETGGSPEHYFEFTKLQMFQDNVFCFTPKGAVIKLPKGGTPVDFAYAVHTKVGDTAIACEINGNSSALQTTLRNGDMIKIITSKKVSIFTLAIFKQNRKGQSFN